MRSLALNISLRKVLPSSLSTAPHSSSSASAKPLRMRSGPRRSWPAAEVSASNSLLAAASSCSFSVRSSTMASDSPCQVSGTACTRAMKLLPSGRRTATRCRQTGARKSASCVATSGKNSASRVPSSEVPLARNSCCRAAFACTSTPSRAEEQRRRRMQFEQLIGRAVICRQIRHMPRYGIGRRPPVWIETDGEICTPVGFRSSPAGRYVMAIARDGNAWPGLRNWLRTPI